MFPAKLLSQEVPAKRKTRKKPKRLRKRHTSDNERRPACMLVRCHGFTVSYCRCWSHLNFSVDGWRPKRKKEKEKKRHLKFWEVTWWCREVKHDFLSNSMIVHQPFWVGQSGWVEIFIPYFARMTMKGLFHQLRPSTGVAVKVAGSACCEEC